MKRPGLSGALVRGPPLQDDDDRPEGEMPFALLAGAGPEGVTGLMVKFRAQGVGCRVGLLVPGFGGAQ